MLRFAPLLTLLLGTSPLVAEPLHVTGQQDGMSLDYTVDMTQDGNLVLVGAYLDTREQFRLTVYRHGHVEGYVGVVPVSFDVPQNERDQVVASLRADHPIEVAQRAAER